MAPADALPVERRPRWRALALLALALALLPAAPGGAVHPTLGRTRSAHARLAAADVVVVATVARVSEGRISLEDARALRGEVPARFLVKRSPITPPPLEAGDRTLLLLRGARPPYVLADRPDETIRLADAAAETRWVEAFSGWLAARERPAAWPALYAGWIERGPDTLRDLAVASLVDPAAPFQPLPDAFAAALGDAVWDPARSLAARRGAAAAAARTTAGARRLVAGLADAPGEPDVALSVAALSVAPLLGETERDAALMRALSHGDAEVRRAALRALEAVPAPSPPIRERLARLAQDDPESWLRAEAERLLALRPDVAAPAP